MFKTAAIIMASLIQTIPKPTTEDMATLKYGAAVCGIHMTANQVEQLLAAYGRKQTTTTYFRQRQAMIASMFVADPEGACGYARDVYGRFFTVPA